jgi:hypothetical protein
MTTIDLDLEATAIPSTLAHIIGLVSTAIEDSIFDWSWPVARPSGGHFEPRDLPSYASTPYEDRDVWEDADEYRAEAVTAMFRCRNLGAAALAALENGELDRALSKLFDAASTERSVASASPIWGPPLEALDSALAETEADETEAE